MSVKPVVLVIGLAALILPSSALSQEGLDIRGGVFSEQDLYEDDGGIGVALPKPNRSSRFEDIRENLNKRPGPRDNLPRQLIDKALQLNLGQTGNDISHSLDAIHNINEALKIKQERLDAEQLN